MVPLDRVSHPDQRYNLLKDAVGIECARLRAENCSEEERQKADLIENALHRLYIAILYQHHISYPAKAINEDIKNKFRLINVSSLMGCPLTTFKQMMELKVLIKQTPTASSSEAQPSLRDALNFSRNNPFNYRAGAMNGPLLGKAQSLSNVENKLIAYDPKALE